MILKRQKRMMQYQLLDLALKEEGITNYKIDIDHKSGFSTVNDVSVYLKYPKSYLEKISKIEKSKKYEYAFKGGLTFSKSEIDRSEILKDYMNRSDSKIVETYYGITRTQKTEFDISYYELLCSAKFSLCPNWSGTQWDHEYAWTYRFIESCFSRSIPIVFESQPLSKTLTKDIIFYWDTQDHNFDYDIVENNYQKAVRYFTLSSDEIKKISSKT